MAGTFGRVSVLLGGNVSCLIVFLEGKVMCGFYCWIRVFELDFYC